MSRTECASVLFAPNDVRNVQVPVLPVGPQHVRVGIRACGVCSSDVHYYRHGRIGDFVVNEPLILGHECAGEVLEVGSNVTRLQPGDRVAVEPGVPCRQCEYCRTGRYNLCERMSFFATPPVHGAFRETVVVEADFAYRIPDSMTYDQAAMLEPLSVGIWAVQRAKLQVGQSVAIIGAGTIGCVTLQVAGAAGATTLIASDVEPFRLDLARRLGATHTIDARRQNTLEEIRRITGSGVDVSFETSGSVPTLRDALGAVKPGGVAVLVGLPPEPEVPVPISGACAKEIDIRGLFRYAHTWPTAIAMVEQRRVDVKSLITHRFALEQAGQALQFADTHRHEAMKVMLEAT